MKKISLFRWSISLVVVVSFFGLSQAQAASWPASSVLSSPSYSSSTIEPSGIIYHSRLDKLFFVGDEGQVIKMNTNGTVETTWNPGGDLEGITIANANSNYVYLALEKPNDSILEFDITSGQLTGKTWDVSSYLISGSSVSSQDANLGMEGLTFIPNGKHPYSNSNSGGVFYTGLQYDGKIYVFDVNLSSSGQFTYLGSLTPVAGRASLSDLYYSSNANTVYVLYGSVVREMRPDTTYVAEYSVPGTRQEGFTLIESCPATSVTAVIAEDTPGSVKWYSSYPINTTSSQYTYYLDADGDGFGSNTSTTLCSSSTPSGYVTNHLDSNDADYDNDGVVTSVDCDDRNSSVTSGYTYYSDVDGDGLGSDTTTLTCSSTPPAGYVSNSNDLNDSDYDNDGVSTGTDCNDADSTISAVQTYYADVDGDGLGSDTTTSVCSYSVPSGYVANSTDNNDTDYDNDGVSTSADCNDQNFSLTTGYTYYLDVDGDGLGSTTSSVSCSLSAPSGYVTNNLDLNDTDYDNDGFSSSVDCNDQDNAVGQTTTYYQDLDSDGMGSSVTTSVCSTTAPQGYVDNSNESRDANDLIPNAGVEIADDLRDNDGDGEIDEYNYLGSNGVHPYYSTFDPANATLAASSMTNLAGATNGFIKVRFADDSVYRYKIFSISTSRLTKVRFYNSTGYLLVTAPSGKKSIVNGYTGAIVRTISAQ